MPRRNDINKVLIIGSGPVIIGQGSEFDYFCTQACKALRSLDCEIVVVNSNPATVMTDPDMAGATYVEPLNRKVITDIIRTERPNALLPNMGGQSGLNLSFELAREGVLKEYGVQVIGVSIDAIECGENRWVFKETMKKLGIETLRSHIANSVEDAEKAADELGYPVVLRPSFTTGGTGSSLVYNIEELHTIAAQGLSASIINQILVEESVLGWEEIEIEVIRDSKNQMVTVCYIENVDAMGIHSGDSLCTTPMLTIAPDLQERLQGYSYHTMEAIGVIGCTHFKFAHDPKTGRVGIVEINTRASRASAMASKATGFPVAFVSSLLACGLTLDEIPYRRNGSLEKYTPSSDTITVKIPRWDFENFEGVEDKLGPQMRSVGEIMSIGKTYKEALQKAIRSLSINHFGLGFVKNLNGMSLEELMDLLATPTSERQFIIYEALRKGADIQALCEKTHIKPWFLEQMKELVQLEEEILKYKGRKLPDELLKRAKKDGFSDKYLSQLIDIFEKDIREHRVAFDINSALESIPIGGAEDHANYYSTYHVSPKVKVGDRKKIMVLGGGPNWIGQGAEFDHCAVNAGVAIRNEGYASIMVNCNPETVSTDFDTFDRLYFEPVTMEEVLRIYEKEKPEGVIVQFGGQVSLNIAKALSDAGVKILGTSSEAIELANDRNRFRRLMRKLGIPQPRSGVAGTLEEAVNIAREIGYPIIVRPTFTLSGRVKKIIHDEEILKGYIAETASATPEQPILLDEFLDNALEAEADAVADGNEAYVPAAMEQIELAGIHSGDSACVIPPVGVPLKHIDTIREYAQKIAMALHVVGLMNIRYAIFNNAVYIIDVNPSASRSVPFVSRVCNVPLAQLATQVILGKKISDLNLKQKTIPHFGIKESVFPFNMFPEVDPLPGPAMRSTGMVLGLADSFGRAFFKSQEATQVPLPTEGTVLFTIADRDKSAALEPVRLFRDLGFRIMTTKGTHQFLVDNGIDSIPTRKIGYGRPHLVDAIKNDEVQLVVNTPSGRQSKTDSSNIRKAAVTYKILYITTTAAAMAAAKGISERKKGEAGVRSLQSYYEGIV